MLHTLWLILLLDLENGLPIEALSVRLVDGFDHCSGRVEVLYNGTWGTVCDDNWDPTDGGVVCREMGCGIIIEATSVAYFGEGSGEIWMDEVGCDGAQSSLTECPANGWGIQDCNHSEDAGVICQSEPLVRLVNGMDSCSGRVEVFYDGQWGTVCDNGWGPLDAAVVCKELGCGDLIAAKTDGYFGQGSGQIWMDNVHCKSNDTKLMKCEFNGWGIHECEHIEDAGVICSPLVRLANMAGRFAGRVEVFHEGQWGTVCDYGWDLLDANVVCRELGFGSAADIGNSSYFGRGSGPVWVYNAQCTGSEASLKRCPSMVWQAQNCTHDRDMGVFCQANVRVNTSSCSGRVEVLHNDQWGTVCTDYWDTKDAEVVCKELGCPTGAEAKKYTYFGQGSGPIWMDNVQCMGNETSLKDCSLNGWGTHNCTHVNDAGIICREGRLVNGDNKCSGRVEYHYWGRWGTICDIGWDATDAAVVCKHMGCGTPIEAKTGAFFGQGSGQIWLEDLNCFGNESKLIQCPSSGLGVSSCNHRQDAGVICREVKLVGGVNACDGRVEILYDGHWGAVCYNGWDLIDATVLCRELDCGDIADVKGYIGPVGPVWMDNLSCTGKEWTVRDCPFTGGVSSCLNGVHAGVLCTKFVRRNAVRILVKANPGVNVNDPDIMKNLLNQMIKIVQGSNKKKFTVTWRTHSDGLVFHRENTMAGQGSQSLTPCMTNN
ncbi:deleted in malignant brain tumors 1 protein-like [Myxocyprinus asiaticus]|uniref:deleted in malignant brain tumors 1 protein-like n=1 Tax=Myxocyprinus asiaticus TaxID=70543 RepID=UPI00222298C6|nr:deleted in malignant brain tumors 1 protein-like [Myxocyprinus asiaticus]